MKGSDHMITTDPPPWEWPRLNGSKHSVTGGAQLMFYLTWMCRGLFQSVMIGYINVSDIVSYLVVQHKLRDIIY